MASFHAVLVLGEPTSLGNPQQTRYPIDICTQLAHQEVDARGRVVSRPRAGELHITMPPPPDAGLIHWANEPFKTLTCCVVFLDLDGRGPSLVLRLEEATCVSYAEHFQRNSDGSIAYFCQLSITAARMNKQGTEFVNPR